MKFKTLFLIAAIAACPLPSRAQNCSDMSYSLLSSQKTFLNSTITQETDTYNVKCTNTNNNTVYVNTNNSVTGSGQGGTINNCFTNCWTNCNPVMTIKSYWQSADPSIQSEFQNFAQDMAFDPSSGCYNGALHETDTFCNGVACSPPPPPPPCSCCKGCRVCPCSSPVLLDISGKGFHLTDASNGVTFDISGTNQPVRMGWTAPGADNAFLALPDTDGLVHNGKQLFGDHTPQPPSDSPNGFAALAVYDDPKNGGNGDGVIDARDAIFASLRLWIDANHDGISQPSELYTLPSLGVNSISLSYKQERKTDQFGNVFRYRAQVNPSGGTDVSKFAYDVFFDVSGPTANNKCVAPSTGLLPAKTGGM
jgi:hypothetical protein